jgi:ABC-type uncharacterized transport system involved in gliding motility auxiliary subunit
LAGNGFTIAGDYSYAEGWIRAAGFTPVVISAADLTDPEAASFFGPGSSPLVVFGSKDLTRLEAAAIETYVEAGGPALFAVSPIDVAISTDWAASAVAHDRLLPVLDAWGFTIGSDVVNDLNCYALTLHNDAGGTEERNYPPWVTVKAARTASIRVFWGGAITTWDDDALTLLATSPASWLQAPETGGTFVTNPFDIALVPNTRGTTKTGPFTVAASYEGTLPGYYNTTSTTTTRVIVIADQYFASDLMMDYTQSSGNLDFLATSLLYLTGETDLAAVKAKAPGAPRDYEAETLAAAFTPTLLFTAVLVPVTCAALWYTLTRTARRRIRAA